VPTGPAPCSGRQNRPLAVCLQQAPNRVVCLQQLLGHVKQAWAAMQQQQLVLGVKQERPLHGRSWSLC
jgi:hypothetical protein